MQLVLYIREGLCICDFKLVWDTEWVHLCASVRYHHHCHPAYCPSSVRRARRKAIMFFNIIQEQSKVCQTCQTQTHTKELLSRMSLMKWRPFKIYERVLKPNYNELSLHLNSKWLHHLLGDDLYLDYGDDALNSLVIKSKEQEECSISFIRARNYYQTFRSCDMKRKET